MFVFFNSAKIILDLKKNWPELIIINGRPRHPQSQELVERANAVVQNMLGKWLKKNNSFDWPTGLGIKKQIYHFYFYFLCNFFFFYVQY